MYREKGNLFQTQSFRFFTNKELKKLKKLFQLFTIVFILFTSVSNAQWVRQSPVPTHLDTRGIAAPIAQKVFIATDNNSFDNGGSLFESNDGGTTWVQRNVPANLGDPFNGIFFLDSLNGWAFGNDNYKTTDGGTTWFQLPFLGSTYSMKFYNQSFGNAAGNFGRMISNDGGNNWIAAPNNMYSFNFINDLIGLGVSEDGLYRTTDGGITFTQVYSGSAEAVSFLSASAAAGIVNDSYIHSSDGGLTWTVISAADNRNRLTPVTENIILSWNRPSGFPNSDGSMSRSTDGGLTWTDLGIVITDGIYAVTVIDPQNLTAADFNGNMFYSANGGTTWTQTYTSPGPKPGYLNSAVPVFADANTGYFGYDFGFIIKSTDGANSWFQVSGGTSQSLNDIERFPDGSLLAVGENGTIVTKSDNSPWSLSLKPTSEELTAVNIISSNEAVAITKQGQLYKTSDKGITWASQGITPPDLNARDLHFNSFLEGWVTGSSFTNAFLYTSDGGSTWQSPLNLKGPYPAVDFESSNGWLLREDDSLYRSTDNGDTWSSVELPGFPSMLTDVEFFNTTHGYVVGWYGYAARTTDGGISWQLLTTPDNDIRFTDIYLTNENTLWISTYDDFAYYSSNGGQNWAILEIGSDGFGSFNSITASLDGDAWTAGYQGYIEHYSGAPPPPLNNPPAASFDYSTDGLTVSFFDTSTDNDGSIISWHWDFDDSTFSAEQNPVHTFPSANTYIVRLTATDDDSAKGTAVRFIVVQPLPGGTYGSFTEVTPHDSVFVTPHDQNFWVVTTAPADYDGDGDLDIAVLGYYGNDSRLLLLNNNGPAGADQWNFTYTLVPLNDLSTGASDMAWGDVDGDGDLDLVVGTNGATVIYLNDNGTLVLSDIRLPGYIEDNDQADFDLRSITLADFDNDGDLDILIPSAYDTLNSTYMTALMRNDGLDGTGQLIFSLIDSVFAPTSHAQSAWADFDGDQDLDLLLVNIAPLTDKGFIKLYRNEGNEVFTGEDILTNISLEHGEVQWGDYDTDGDLDILIAGHVKDTTGIYRQILRIYRNDGNTFTPLDVIDCIPCLGWLDLTAVTWADYDSDGDMDILLAGSYNSGSQIEGRARIYTNNNGVFTESTTDLPAPRASGSRGGTFSWFDIDGDGDLDYFIAGQYFIPGGNGLIQSQMHLYRNDAEQLNNAPAAPGGLNAQINENRVLLSWNSSSDDHTPAAALTYELELFRNNVPVNIPKRLPQPGNLSAVTEWSLTGLPDGNYTWSIKAVDAAYIGSPASMGTFNIGISSAGEEHILPLVFNLEQNYPNPFNPSTVIKYSIPHEGIVTLKVYNTIGEEVAVLFNGYRQAGSYETEFEAYGLPSQIYIYRLQSGSYTDTKKMILLK
jgi:photosystem II stability/assembly factor-like uncharacterized protein